MKTTEHRYEVLDGMRGIAAIWVMIGHASLYSAHTILPDSYIAVDLFFILSGFVLAYSYGGKGLSLGALMARRFIRLYPMFLAGLILGLIVLLIGIRHGLSTLTTKAAIAGTILNAFYVPFLNQGQYYYAPGQSLPGEIFAADSPYWSLSFEIVVNLFFLNLVGLKRKALAYLSGIFLVLIFVTAFLSGLINVGARKFDLSTGWSTLNMMAALPRVFYGFCLGILLFKLSKTDWAVSAANTLKRMPGSVFFLLAVTALLFSAPNFRQGDVVYYLVAVGLVAPALVLLGSALHCQNRLLLRLVQFLGWLSYPLYCVHYPIIRAVNLLQPKYPLPGNSSIIVSCLLSVCAAAILTLVYDQPVRNWLKRFLGRPAGAVSMGAPTLAE